MRLQRRDIEARNDSVNALVIFFRRIYEYRSCSWSLASMSRCALVVFVVANRWGPALMTADDQDKIINVVVGTDRTHQPHHRNGITSHPDLETDRYRARDDDLVVTIVTHASTVQSFSSS